MHASLLETFSFTIVHPVSPQCIGVRQAERAETPSKMNKAKLPIPFAHIVVGLCS